MILDTVRCVGALFVDDERFPSAAPRSFPDGDELIRIFSAMRAAGVHAGDLRVLLELCRERYPDAETLLARRGALGTVFRHHWRETQKQLAARPDAKRRREYRKYIRFGRYPPDGISRHHRTGKPEREAGGVSVFRARKKRRGVYVVDAAAGLHFLMLFKDPANRSRRVSLARGVEVRSGDNVEPLLYPCELDPLPEGTRVECSTEWHAVAVLTYAACRLGGVPLPESFTAAWGDPARLLELPEPIIVPSEATKGARE